MSVVRVDSSPMQLEYVAPGPAEVVCSPALDAADHLFDLFLPGLGEGDPEYEAAADRCVALRGYRRAE